MKKGYMYCGFLAIILAMGCSCQKTKNTAMDEKLYTLEEVRGQAEDTMSKAYNGGYKNLTFSSFSPEITKDDSVSEYQEERTEYGKPEKTMKECVEEQYKNICAWLGKKKVDKSKITDFKSEENLLQVEKMLKDGTYPEEKGIENGDGKPWLLYKDEENGIFISVNSGWCDYEASINSNYNKEYEVVKEYQVNVKDGSTKDKYVLQDGKCSIAQAVQFAEQFQNKDRPIPCGKEFVIKAEKVRVRKFKDGTYGYDILMHRLYKGIPFVGMYQGASISAMDIEFDMGIFFMTNRVQPDTCMGLGANETMKMNGKTYKNIISLDRVFTLISEKLGNNAKCNVQNACLAYKQNESKRDFTKNGYRDTCQITPVWYVELQNATDEHVTQIYVELQDYAGKNIIVNTVK